MLSNWRAQKSGRPNSTETGITPSFLASDFAQFIFSRFLSLVGTKVDNSALPIIVRFKSLENLDLRGTKIDDAALAEVEALTHLKDLNISNTGITDMGVKRLQNLAGLQALRVMYTKIGDPGVASLTRLKQLRVLLIDGTAVTGAALDSLITLPNLEELTIADCRISPQDLGKLEKFPAIRKLRLGGQNIGTEEVVACLPPSVEYLTINKSTLSRPWMQQFRAMKKLKGLRLESITAPKEAWSELTGLTGIESLAITGPTADDEVLRYVGKLYSSLVELELDKTKITDKGAIHLKGLSFLRRLSLRGTALTDAGILSLSNAKIISLDLSGTKITDESLGVLATMAHLEMLDLTGTQVTQDGIRLLRKAIPGISVIYH